MNNLHRSETTRDATLKQVAVIQGMIDDLERSVQILSIDICNEEERVRVFNTSSPAYPVLAKALAARRDNLNLTIVLLAKRLHGVTVAAPATQAA